LRLPLFPLGAALLGVSPHSLAQQPSRSGSGPTRGGVLERGPERGGPGSVVSHAKISNRTGGFPDTLESYAELGSALANLGDLDGDGLVEVAAGAPGDHDGGSYRGAVWLLSPAPDGALREHRKISSLAGGFRGLLRDGDDFGCALAALGDLDGDGVGDLAVGAQNDSDGSYGSGAVWVLFLNADASVKAHRKISSTQGGFGGVLQFRDSFGSALAALGDLDGDGIGDLAVGAAGDDEGGSACGAAWVLFLARDGTVRAQRKLGDLQLGGLDAGDGFGCALAGLGDLDGDGVRDLAAGANRDDDGGAEHGAVWVLFLAPDGSLRAQQKISATQGGFTGPLGVDFFGHALANLGDLDGDGLRELGVGAILDGDLVSRGGALWILSLRADGSVQAQRKISGAQGGFAGPLDPYDHFGSAVAALGDLDGDGRGELAAGAPQDDDGGDYERGAVWVLELDAVFVVQTQQKISDRPGSLGGTLDYGDLFGSAVVALGDLDGDGIGELAVGAPWDDDGRGAVWVLFLDAAGAVKAYRKINATEGGFTGVLDFDVRFGHALAAPGDLDGDGVVDLCVGAPRDRDGGSYHRGAVWILFLEPDGSVQAHQKLSATQGGLGALDPVDSFGYALAPLGDLDGNGVTDLAASALLDDDGGLDRGAVWVLFLAADGTVVERRKISATEGGFTGVLRDHDNFGSSLAVLGDLDGDGVGELAVGASNDDDGGPDRGAVWVLSLASDGSVQSHRKLSSTQGGFRGELRDGDAFGGALACPGDLDGDGTPELVVGAPYDDDGGRTTGAAWVLFLAPDGGVRRQRELGARAGRFAGALDAEDLFGAALAALGDLDGDGLGELAVGAPGDDDGGENHGALWLLHLDGVARLDFERGLELTRAPLENGRAVGSPGPFERTLALTGAGANLGPAVFDSTPAGPNDPSQDRDLLVGRGNVLVLQNSLVPTQSVAGVFDHPNDDPDGGTFAFTFRHGPVELHSLDLVDIDGGASQRAALTLLDAAGRQRRYSVPAGFTEDLLTDGGPAWRRLQLRTLSFQLGFADLATASEDPGFDPRAVLRLEVELGSSGALDELRWDPHPDD
jgi:FG-GAP repeat protein